MSRRIFAAAAALCLSLSGCGYRPAPQPTAQPAPSAEVTAAPVAEHKPFALPVETGQGWEPYAGSKSSNMSLLGLVCESLFALDNTFTPQPLLAQRGEVSEDGLSWTVTLREGVTFSNGEALDAKRVVSAVTAAKGEKSVYAARLSGVKKVTAQKDGTVLFQLAAPNADFPALLDFPIALVTRDGVYGTGPYVLGQGELTARADWWRGLALPLPAIPLREETGSDGLIADFSAGDISLVAADPTGSDALAWSGSCQSWEYPTSTMLYLGFRCTKGPCKSAAFRRAVSRALDRDDLVGRVLTGHALAAALPVPPTAARYDGALAGQAGYDALAAAEALDELGYTLGDDGLRYSGRQAVALTLAVNADNVYKEALARAVADALGALGIQVTVKTLAWEDYKKALSQGDFDLYLAESRLTGDLDVGPFLTAGSGLCYGGFSSRELSDALAEARRSGEWAAFYALWLEEMPVATLCFKNAAALTRWGQVEGATPTQGNLFYGFADWKIS